MRIFAIDPGTTESGAVIYDTEAKQLCAIWPAIDNYDLLSMIGTTNAGEMAIEMVASYGMPVGREVFETCVWIGRFMQKFDGRAYPIYRRDVKLHLCGQPRAKDANITCAIKDRFGGESAVGTKKHPGPLYGVSKHAWAALGVAITASENPVDTLTKAW